MENQKSFYAFSTSLKLAKLTVDYFFWRLAEENRKNDKELVTSLLKSSDFFSKIQR